MPENLGGLLILALPLVLLFFLTSRARRQQRDLSAAQSSVAPGARVVTTTGLHAEVVAVGEDSTVVLQIAPGVHTTWSRRAIGRVLPDPIPDDGNLSTGPAVGPGPDPDPPSR